MNDPMSDTPPMSDFPKLQCPFVRESFDVDREQWKKHGSKLQLREPRAYLATDQVNPGYEWVFEDRDTVAVEKLNGSNVKIKTRDGRLVAVQNRKNVVDMLQVMKGKTFLIEGVFISIGKGYVKADGEQAGELIGPKVQGNPYHLPIHEWYPFEKALTALSYRSFHEHEPTFDNLSLWFEKYLASRYFAKRSKFGDHAEKVMAEGVVFYNLKRKAEGKTYMAKLRRDMFPWFYSGQIEILGYDKAGRE